MPSATPKDHRRLKAKVRTLLAESASEYDICEELDLTPTRAKALIREVLADEAAAVQGDTPAETFARYSIHAAGLLDDLDDVIENGKGGKDKLGLNAVVAAVKAKHQIASDVVALGQKLGIVHSAPEPELQVGGRTTKNMKTGELRDALAEKRKELLDTVRKYGDSDYLDGFDEDDKESLYQSADSPGDDDDPDDSPDERESGTVTRKRA